jgi:ACT domain-containing protein
MMEKLEYKLVINLEDKPGELSKILDVLAKNKGNLFTVSHLREKKKEEFVPVVFRFEAEVNDFDGILGDLKAKAFEVMEKSVAGREEKLFKDFVAIGHVIDTDIKDTIYGIAGEKAIVTALDINIKSLKEPSSVFIQVTAKDENALKESTKKLRKICEEKDLLLIEQVANGT